MIVIVPHTKQGHVTPKSACHSHCCHGNESDQQLAMTCLNDALIRYMLQVYLANLIKVHNQPLEPFVAQL
jgi:hypothetical protein